MAQKSSASSRHKEDLKRIQKELATMDSSRYTVLSYLGRGSYGMVVSAKDNVTGEKVAIKTVYPEIFARPMLATRVLREILLMSHFSHPNIIGIQNLLMTPAPPSPVPPSSSSSSSSASNPADLARIYIVMDIMDMDLHALLRSGQPLTEQHVKFFAVQILAALDCIHGCGVIHRDLTPSNCLLSTSCDLKVCDFGLAREQSRDMTDYVVMRWYRAPELIMELPSYDSAVDIWAAGCILGFLLHGGEPVFKGESAMNQLEQVMNIIGTPTKDDLRQMKGGNEAVRAMVQSKAATPGVSLSSLFCTPEGKPPSEQCLHLLRWMLSFNPRNRPTAREAMAHPYLAEYHPESLPPPGPTFELGSAIEGKLTPSQVTRVLRGLQRTKGWGGVPREAAPQRQS
eukprot:RCo032954